MFAIVLRMARWFHYEGPPRIQHRAPGHISDLQEGFLYYRHADLSIPDGSTKVDLVEHLRDPETEKVAIFRVGPLGDAILGLFCTRILAKAYPLIEWVFITHPNLSPILRWQDDVEVMNGIEAGMPRMRKRMGLPFIVTCHYVFEVDHQTAENSFRYDLFLNEFGVEIDRG